MIRLLWISITGSEFEPHHYAFKVSEEEFDQILRRIQVEETAYGSGPRALDDKTI